MRHLSFPVRLTLLVIGTALAAILATTLGQSRAARQGFVENGRAALEHVAATLAQAIILQSRLEEEGIRADLDIARTTVELAGFPVVEPLAEAEILLDGEATPSILPSIKVGRSYLHESAPALSKAASLTRTQVHFLQLHQNRLVRIAGGAPEGKQPWPQGSWLAPDHPATRSLTHEQRPWMGIVEHDGSPWLAAYSPVKDLGDQVIGAVEVVRPLIRPEFGRFVHATGVGGAGSACLLDAQGRPLTPQAPPKLLSHVHTTHTRQGEFASDGETLVWQQVSDLPWGMRAVLWVPQAHLLSGLQARILQGVLTSLPVPLALALLVGIGGSHLLLRPVARMAEAATCAAAGDYSRRLDASHPDAIGQLSHAMNVLLARLEGLFAEIHQAAGQITDAATDLSSSSHGLLTQVAATVSRSEHVTASTHTMETNLDAVAAAMEEASANAQVLTQSVEEISAHMNRMRDDAAASRATADAAMGHASAAADTTRQLEAASRRIDEITGLIHSIATRTQILALNATIEAGRAGEAGRSFAVVAREIKDLAQKTAEATAEVEAALSSIREKAHAAREHNDQVQTMLATTLTSMTAVAEAVSIQAHSVQESSTAISHLFLGLQEISAKTTTIAALCQDTTQDMTAVHHATDTLHAEGETIRAKAHDLELLAQRLLRLILHDKAQRPQSVATSDAPQTHPRQSPPCPPKTSEQAPQASPLSRFLRRHGAQTPPPPAARRHDAMQ